MKLIWTLYVFMHLPCADCEPGRLVTKADAQAVEYGRYELLQECVDQMFSQVALPVDRAGAHNIVKVTCTSGYMSELEWSEWKRRN